MERSKCWWIIENNESKVKKVEIGIQNHYEGGRRLHRFSVSVDFDLGIYEKVAVTGNCNELGNWNPDYCLFLSQDEGSKTWSADLEIPSEIEINFRYFIASINPFHPECVNVRKWEVNLAPRVMSVNSSIYSETSDTFGVINGSNKVDKGWLRYETLLQFKLFNNPLRLEENLKNQSINVKLSLVDLQSISSPNAKQPYGFSEVSTLNGSNPTFSEQAEYGQPFLKDDILFFNVNVMESENVAYLFEFFNVEKAERFGSSLLLPNFLNKSGDQLELVIMENGGKYPLGLVNVEYVKITPLESSNLDMKISYSRYWNENHKGWDIGHRGAGNSFKESVGPVDIRENTIASFRRACEAGAKMVELDVQLSKDLIPIIYHDYYGCIKSSTKEGYEASDDILKLPVHHFTLDQLQNLKILHVAEKRTKELKFHDENLIDHQPFPTLSHALEVVDKKLGFNIEIKSSQEREDGTHEDEFYMPIDKNTYIDSILKVVLSKAGSRRIIFSSFDSDVCVMLRNKQNIYPTMFLANGVSNRYINFRNPCSHTMENAAKFSISNELLGVVAHSEDLLRDISQVKMIKDMGIILICWGDDNNSKEAIKLLKEKGLDGIIYDKIDKLIE